MENAHFLIVFRSDIKEEEEDEFEDEDEDDVSRTPASTPGCDSPEIPDVNCDYLNSRFKQQQSIHQSDAKHCPGDQATSLNDFIKGK